MTSTVNRPTRRQAITATAAIASGIAMHPSQLSAEAEEISHAAESIHQEVIFEASRERVFDALTIASQFDRIVHIGSGANTSSLGGEPTAIGREVGSVFTLFGGHIIGRQLELVPNERIVQAWRVADWDPGDYSIAKFELVEANSRTRIIFDHTGFPKGKGEHLLAGWKSRYWEPLERFLANKSE